MKRLFILIVFCISTLLVSGQDRSAWYFTGNSGIPVGNYRDFLSITDDNRAQFGLSLGFLTNPRKSIDYAFPISLGGEIGFQGLGRDAVPTDVGGSFSNSHFAYWLNFVSRYRPVEEFKKLKPFFEVQVGPRLNYSRITEQISNEESLKIDGFSSWSKNYGLGAGFDVKLNANSNSESNNHLEVAIYYFYGERTKTMARNSALIDADGFSNYRLVISNSQQIQLRIGIIGLN